MIMKGKVFKNKFVFWTILLLNIILLISFSIGIYNKIENYYADDFIDVLLLAIISVVTLLSFISLTLFITKNKNSIIVFSAVLILILLFISVFVFYSIFIVKDFGENVTDLYTVSGVYFIIFGILFIIHKFKYRQDLFELELEEIGTREN